MLGNGYVIESNKYTTSVTGIPYSISLDNVSAPSGWSASRTANSKYLCLQEGTAYVVSMPFGVPEECDVTVTIPIYAYGGSMPNKYKPTVYASATSSTSGSKAGVSTTLQGIVDMPKSGSESYTDWKPNLSLSNTAPRVSIYANGSKYWSSTTISGYYIGVIMKSVTVNYQL